MAREDKILIVEDNAAITRAIEEHYDCDRAADGWDAIEKLETCAYAAIIIDADVPRHSGYGVLTYLREEIGEELGNVILMTSSCDHDAVRAKVGEHLTVVDKENALAEIARKLEG